MDDDANAWHRKGIELGKSGCYEEALQAFDKALGLNSDVSTAWYNKGIALDNLFSRKLEVIHEVAATRMPCKPITKPLN